MCANLEVANIFKLYVKKKQLWHDRVWNLLVFCQGLSSLGCVLLSVEKALGSSVKRFLTLVSLFLQGSAWCVHSSMRQSANHIVSKIPSLPPIQSRQLHGEEGCGSRCESCAGSLGSSHGRALGICAEFTRDGPLQRTFRCEPKGKGASTALWDSP